MPQLLISSPGNNTPGHPVNASGCIEAHGTIDQGNLQWIKGAIFSGTPMMMACPPSGVSGQLGGFSGPNWFFGRSGASPICGAQSGCQKQTLVVWGLTGAGVTVCSNTTFLGQSGSTPCSGFSRSPSVPTTIKWAAKELAMTVSTFKGNDRAAKVKKVKSAKTKSKSSNSSIILYETTSYVLTFDTNGSSLDAPVWTMIPSKQPNGVPQGIEDVKLQVLNIDGEIVGVLACLEKFKDGKQVAFRRHCWTARDWDFCGENWLRIEPYGCSETDAPPWIIKPK
jgi:hypothetical protein